MSPNAIPSMAWVQRVVTVAVVVLSASAETLSEFQPSPVETAHGKVSRIESKSGLA